MSAEGISAEELPTDSEGEAEHQGGDARGAGRDCDVVGAQKMSKSRATGLAKVNLVIEWLASALGGAGAAVDPSSRCDLIMSLMGFPRPSSKAACLP